jgi:hypothetical protein
LPPEWEEGAELNVEIVCSESPATDNTERAFEELERLCAQGDEADYQRLQAALEDADREAKKWFLDMEAAAALVDRNDAAIIDAAIREAVDIAKEQVRREMGLP